MSRRVVITGMGVVSPLGDEPAALFRALVEGRSGVGRITRFDAGTMPTTFAAEVRGFDLANYVPDAAARWPAAGLNTRFALAATQRALADAGLLDGADRDRFGIYLGTGEGSQDFPALLRILNASYHPEERRVDHRAYTDAGQRFHYGPSECEQEIHVPTARLAAQFDLRGPNYSCLTACAAGSQALGEARDLIRTGEADLMLAGGTHSMIHPLGVGGFNLLTALSTFNQDPPRASRPFDLRRDGFVLGEGAGLLVLEELEHAKRRGARIYAELTGYGSTADAYRFTDSHPEGRGAAAAIRLALQNARLAPADVGYINAHGTATQLNDRTETLAIKTIFGEHAYKVPVSSTKSMLGHMIAAAGAVELIACIQSIHAGVIHPTINYETPDPSCDLDYVPNQAREQRADHVLSNSFGFGGQNVSLVVSRFNG